MFQLKEGFGTKDACNTLWRNVDHDLENKEQNIKMKNQMDKMKKNGEDVTLNPFKVKCIINLALEESILDNNPRKIVSNSQET